MKTVNLNIRISEEMRNEFKRIAEENAQNPSALMRKWIKNYIKENKNLGGIEMIENVEVHEVDFIEEFEKDISNTTDTGKHAYVLSKINNGEFYEVSYEIDELGTGNTYYFKTEKEARDYIEKENV